MGQERISSAGSVETEWVTLAKVGRAFGVAGWVHVHLLGDDPAFLLSLDQVNLLYPSGQDETVQVAGSKIHSVAVVMSFEGVSDRDLVKRFTNAVIRVQRDDLPGLPDDEHYWVDMLGCDVEDTQGQPLGVVDHFFETGAHQVMALKQQQRTHCVPFIMNDTVISVDLDNRRIVMDWALDE